MISSEWYKIFQSFLNDSNSDSEEKTTNGELGKDNDVEIIESNSAKSDEPQAKEENSETKMDVDLKESEPTDKTEQEEKAKTSTDDEKLESEIKDKKEISDNEVESQKKSKDKSSDEIDMEIDSDFAIRTKGSIFYQVFLRI